MIVQSILEIQDLLLNIDKHINKSDYKTDRIIKELDIAPATYYRKLREKRFDIGELIKIVHLIYPSDFEKYYIKQRLEKSMIQAEQGSVSTTEDVMSRYRKKYLNK